jgi:hypothetical protein
MQSRALLISYVLPIACFVLFCICFFLIIIMDIPLIIIFSAQYFIGLC